MKPAPEDILHLDFETFSEADIGKTGAHKYAKHPSTRALCAAWAFSNDEPKLWLPGEPCPPEIVDHILSGGDIAAWNAQFERLIMTWVMPRLYGWPTPKTRQFRCVMVQAFAMAFPGKLEKCAPAIGLEQRKDDKGRRIMLQLCKPRIPTKKFPLPYFTPETHPDKFEALYEYCLQDVRVERAIDDRLVRLIPVEQERYWLDQEINDRGVPIDLELVDAAQRIVDETLPKLDAEMREVTYGAVASCNATTQLRAWLNAGGIECKSVDKDSIIKLLRRDDLSNSQRVAILLRQEAAKSSTAKLNSFRTHVDEDDRVRGCIQFNGAMTGRDAARGVQVQNFPRPDRDNKTNIKQVIDDLIAGKNADYIRCMHGSPMTVVADILRSIIGRFPGKQLMAQDLSQIEARLTAYLAGQEDKVEAFRRYDRGDGPDIYTVSASGIYGLRADEIDAERRQVGKVSTLALGFGGGAGAFGSMAKLYGVDLVPLYGIVKEIAAPEHHDKVLEGWFARGRSSGMKKAAWHAAEYVKLAWRDDNLDTVEHWKALDAAAIDALMHPGQTFRCRDIRYRKPPGSSFLKCILPSGRPIWYPFPRLVEEPTPWGRMRTSFRFKGVDGYTRQWKEFGAYGGFLHQNTVQATARDVMFDALDRTEAAGYPNVMRVHDELVSEVDDDFGDEEEYHDLIVQVPKYLPGLPIAADGWRKERYGK